MALFLSEDDVKQVLTATMALEAVESAHRDLSLGQAQDTPRARTRLPQTVLHILQGALPAQGVLGYKAYTTNRSGNRFLVYMFDAASGRLLALIEADYMGMIRPGAASGVAAQWLARPDTSVAGVFGAGWQAEGHVRGICAAMPLELVKVFSRNAVKLSAFCERLSGMTGVAVVPAASAEDTVRGSSLIGTVTTAATKGLFSRAARQPVKVPAGLPDLVEALLDVCTPANSSNWATSSSAGTPDGQPASRLPCSSRKAWRFRILPWRSGLLPLRANVAWVSSCRSGERNLTDARWQGRQNRTL